MNKLDEAIAGAAFILDTLMAYRRIVEAGDCNSCKNKRTCVYAPELGQLTRYNCPHYQSKEEN